MRLRSREQRSFLQRKGGERRFTLGSLKGELRCGGRSAGLEAGRPGHPICPLFPGVHRCTSWDSHFLVCEADVPSSRLPPYSPPPASDPGSRMAALPGPGEKHAGLGGLGRSGASGSWLRGCQCACGAGPGTPGWGGSQPGSITDAATAPHPQLQHPRPGTDGLIWAAGGVKIQMLGLIQEQNEVLR